jgi:tRNA uridine 5-carboxymethylaminomethyl modification enzyme
LKLHGRKINPFLASRGLSEIDSSETISKLCKRPELTIKDIVPFLGPERDPLIDSLLDNEKALEQVEIEIKYEGYIKQQYFMVDRLERYEHSKIPLTLNYRNIKALSTEGREKLNRVKPRSIGQASRISGVTPSDISILLVYLKN